MHKSKSLKKHSFKTNAVFSAIYQIVKIIVPFITSPYVSRILGSSNIGAYSYAYSIVYFFTIFAAFGFTDYGNLAISQVREDPIQRSNKFYEIMIAKAILTLLSVAVYLPLVFSLSDLASSHLLYLTLGIYLLGTLFDASFMLMGEEEYVSIAIKDIIVKVVSTILIFVLVRDNSYTSLILYTSILAGSTLLSSLLIIHPCRKHLVKINRKDLDIMSAFKQGLIFFIPTLVSSVYMNLNKTFIGLFGGGDTENANYEQATKTITFITTALGALNSVVTSRIANIYKKEGMKGIKNKIYEVIHLIFVLALPCFAGIILIAPYFVPVFYGSGYEGAIEIIYVLSLNVLTIPLAWLLLASYFIPTNKRGRANWINLISAIVDLILCLILIPTIKGVGAGIAYMAAEIIQVVLFIFVSRKDLDWYKIFTSYFSKAFLSTFFMTVAIVVFIKLVTLSNVWMLVLSVLIGVVVYGVSILLLREELVLKYSKLFLHKVGHVLRRKKQ